MVDSSGWLEFFAGTGAGQQFRATIEDKTHLIVPTIVLYEVFKKLLVERGSDVAESKLVTMKQGLVVDLTTSIALHAAQLSRDRKLPMAGSMIYATALAHSATLWTQDAHFENVPGVKYFPKG